MLLTCLGNCTQVYITLMHTHKHTTHKHTHTCTHLNKKQLRKAGFTWAHGLRYGPTQRERLQGKEGAMRTPYHTTGQNRKQRADRKQGKTTKS